MSGWELVTGWIRASTVPVEPIAADDAHREAALEQLEITTNSPLGAIVRRTAGLSVDHGWLRVLGAGGSEQLEDGVNEWSERTGLLIVAHDVAGGFFSWDEERGVLYHAPDSRQAEDLGGRGYSDWLEGMLTGNLAKFYAAERFAGWAEETKRLSGDEGFSQYPPRGTKEAATGDVDRRGVPMTELWALFTSS